jgi:hypothetical protein
VCRVTRYPRRFLIEEEFVSTWEDPAYDEGGMLASRLAKWKEETLAFYVQQGLPIETVRHSRRDLWRTREEYNYGDRKRSQMRLRISPQTSMQSSPIPQR